MERRQILLAAFGLWPVFLHAPALAQPTEPLACTDCHNGDADTSLPPQEVLLNSTHASLTCTDCHEVITVVPKDADAVSPHRTPVSPVDCDECHDEEAEIYQTHGRLEVGRDPDLPRCASCHGTHDILPSSDRRSRVHPVNLPGTCRACHTSVDLVKQHATLRDEPITLYESSVHGEAARKGLYTAATCNDCHSAKGEDGHRTAHRILSPVDPDSTIYHFNIPDTCGQCHKTVTQDFWDGVHGEYVKRGSVDAPVCTHCHGEHGIISHDDPRSPVSAIHMAEQTCTPCHESAVLNEKYGLPGGRLAAYIDSYHGLKSQAGDVTVANCASCHGAHRILPSSDPSSSIHPSRLQATCGACHPGISKELAQARIHETTSELAAGWPEFFRRLYLVLIVVTVGVMLLHNGADWVGHVRRQRSVPFVRRFTAGEVAQHWVLMLTFALLVVSGFALRFSEAAWVRLIFGWEGGFEMRGVVHRVAAFTMTALAVWHALYLLTVRGRRWFKDMVPTLVDAGHLRRNIWCWVGLSAQEPRFGRFSYVEKVEYWAMVWGTAVMIGTGGLLWFDNYFVERWGVGAVVVEVCDVVHYYEAWLATLAILVWHVYGTVFKPTAYPMNPAWLTGRMPKRMYDDEHPNGPKLTAPNVTIRPEEGQ